MLPEKPWKLEGILRLMVGIFACLSFISLLQAGLQYFLGKDTFNEGSLPYLVFSSLSLHGSILFGAAVLLWWHRLSWAEAFGFSTPPVGAAIFLGLLTSIAFLPVGILLQEISIRVLAWYQVAAPPQEAVQEFGKAVSLPSRIYFAVFSIVIAPVAEEVFFRGILYPALKRFGYTRFALWGSALIFSAIHHNAAVFLPLFLFGMVLAWLYEKTNNLLASITAHSVFNSVGIILLYAGDSLDKYFNRYVHPFR